jgi:O-antigen/teichoic acid export membrane protein
MPTGEDVGAFARARELVVRHRSRMLRFSTVAAGSAVARLSAFLVTVILARALGPVRFGDFSLFFALLVPFSFATQFIDVTYVRQANTPGGADRVVLLRASLGLKMIIVGLLMAFSYPIGFLLAHYAFSRPELALPLAGAVVAGSLIGVSTLWASMYLAAQRYLPFSILNSVFYLAVLAVLVPVFIAEANLTANVSYVIFVAAAVAVAAVAFERLWRTTRRVPMDRRTLSTITSFGKWLIIANIVDVVGQRLDLIAVAHYVTTAEVGLYSAALRIAVIASLLTSALSGFLLPRVAGALATQRSLQAYVRESLSISALIVVGVGLLWALAPLLARELFGGSYAGAANLTRIILLGTLLNAVSTPMASLLLAEDVPRRVVRFGLGRVVVILAVTVALAPGYGARGAAWAFAAAEAFALVYAGSFVIRQWRTLSDDPACGAASL